MTKPAEFTRNAAEGRTTHRRTHSAATRWLSRLGFGALLTLGLSGGTTVLAQANGLTVADLLNGYQAYLLGPTTFSTDNPAGTAGDYSIDFTTLGNSGVVISNASFLNIASSQDIMSFSFWLKRYNVTASSAFWGNSPSSSGTERGFQAHVPWSDDTIYFDTSGCCNGATQRISENISSFAGYLAVGNDTWWNSWHHFVFLKNGPDKQIWIDGQLFFEGSSTAPLPSDFTDLWLGNLGNASGALEGLMHDFAVYATALSSASITELASGISPTNLPGETILAYWSFNNPPAIGAVAGSPVGFSYTLYNISGRSLDPTTLAVTLNGQAVTPVVSTNGTTFTVNYLLPNPPFPAGSTNTASLTVKDTLGNTYSNAGSFVVPQFGLVQSAFAVTGVNTSQPGFRILPWQSGIEPNRVYWVEEQLEGLHGASDADMSQATDNGFIDYTGVINFNLSPNGDQNGNFQTSNGYTDSPFPGLDLNNGLPDTGDESLMVLTFLQFANAGLYTMGVNSDDGFVVTTGLNPRDRLATVCGEYDGGRGSSDTTFQLYVQSPGIYPFCLRYENGNGSFSGGNAANLEWFMVSPSGTKILINDPSPTNTSGVKAFFSGPAPSAYVSQLNPYSGQTGAWPDRVLVQLTDGATQVRTVVLLIDGNPTSPVTTKQGLVTTVLATLSAPGLSAGPHTASLVWSDTGTINASNSWSFTVGSFPTLYTSMSAPANSVDRTKPGFVLQVTQLDPGTVGDSGDTTANNVEENNAHLKGLYFPDYGTNTVDTVGGGATGVPAMFGNIWYWTNVVDFNIVTSPGDFGYDYGLPGIPGVTGSTTCIAAGFQTYVVFPSAGFYRMGVNSDDGFRITEGIGVTRQVLHVTGAGIDEDVVGVLNSTNDATGAFGGSLPLTPLIAEAVYLDANASCPNLPAGNLTNKIGIIEYNTCSGAYNVCQAAWCVQTNGGLAAIIVNQPSFGLPFNTDGSSGLPVTIPTFVVNGRSADGSGGEFDFWRTNSLVVNIGADLHLKLGEANYGKGMSDVDSGFWVPTPGAYPLRLLYFQGTGGAGCEWSTVTPGVPVDGGARSLLNDTTDPNSLMAYRAVTKLPTLSEGPVIGGMVTVTWQGAGLLQSSPTIHPADWMDVNPQPGNNVYTTPVTSGPVFYRVRVPDPVIP